MKARRLTDVADNILRFAPIDLSRAQFATIHGANEHIAIKNIGECVVFYKDVIKKYRKQQGISPCCFAYMINSILKYCS